MASKNWYTAQLVGPFAANQELYRKMYEYSTDPGDRIPEIFKIGIVSDWKHKVSINGQVMEIGKTKVLEFRDTEVKSLFFLQDEPAETFIEYCCNKPTGDW